VGRRKWSKENSSLWNHVLEVCLWGEVTRPASTELTKPEPREFHEEISSLAFTNTLVVTALSLPRYMCVCVYKGSGAHPGSYYMSTGVIFPGLTQPEREAGHLPPSSAEIKNDWSCTLVSPYTFMACMGRLLPLPVYNTKWQREVEDCYQHSDFKFTWSCQLMSVIGIYQLGPAIPVGMRGYLYSLLVGSR
jgi:hypothetical protein